MVKPRKKTWKGYDRDELDKLYRRVEDCQSVIDHLQSCPAWHVITKDLKEQMDDVDARWHMITDEEKLTHARYLKYAYMHLLNIVDKYVYDRDSAAKLADEMKNQKSSIMKDYDTETNLEK